MSSTQQVSATRVIAADPDTIFAVLVDPSLHPVIDGSGSVQHARGTTAKLELGSTFGMDMKMGMPYKIKNTVVEFEPGRLIAWRHFNGHRWRYELEPVDGGTKVTETFDWSTARFPKGVELAGFPKKNLPAMERTLEKLEAYVTAD
jgi:uncharacterized protein YndB with AHSA1/START domain